MDATEAITRGGWVGIALAVLNIVLLAIASRRAGGERYALSWAVLALGAIAILGLCFVDGYHFNYGNPDNPGNANQPYLVPGSSVWDGYETVAALIALSVAALIAMVAGHLPSKSNGWNPKRLLSAGLFYLVSIAALASIHR